MAVLQSLRDHRHQRRLLYTAQLSITIDGENKIFYDKLKLKQYLSTNLPRTEGAREAGEMTQWLRTLTALPWVQ